MIVSCRRLLGPIVFVGLCATFATPCAAQPIPGATPGAATSPPITAPTVGRSGPPALDAAAPHVTSVPTGGISHNDAVLRFSKPTTADAQRRLRANGLDANDPNLTSRLNALAKERLARFKARPVPTASPTPVATAFDRQALAAFAASHANVRFDAPRAFQTPGPIGVDTATPGPPPIVVGGSLVRDATGLTHVDGANFFDLTTNATFYTSGMADRISLATQTCSWKLSPAVVGTYGQLPSGTGPIHLLGVPPVYWGDDSGAAAISVTTSSHGREQTSNTYTLSLPHPADTTLRADAAIASDGTANCNALVACTASSFVPSTASRVSTNVNDPVVEGDDVIGYGIDTVNSYVATATISSVSSYRDAPGSNDPNNQFRSATIVQQPDSGRILTRVHWRHAGGESIAYVVTYTLVGHEPLRATTAVGKQALRTCPGER